MERLLEEASAPTTPALRLLELASEHPALLKAVASNPAAPPEWLEATSKEKDPEVRRCIAQNPNTPIKVLLIVGGEFPRELLANPAFALFFLENPNFVHQATDYLLSRVVVFEEVPPLLLQRAVMGRDHVRRAAAANPALPEDALFRLGGDESFEIRKLILSRPWRSPKRELLRRLGVSAEQPSLPTDKSLRPDELSQLCQSGVYAQWMVACHPNVTAELLERLGRCDTPNLSSVPQLVLSGLARNPKTPEPIIAKLAKRYEVMIRIALLENPMLPASIVQEFASRPNTEHALKIALAARPELSAAQLEFFSKSGRIAIRAAIAKNPSVSGALLASLCDDPSPSVRGLVAAHPALLAESLEVLARAPLASVRLNIAKRPDLTPALIELLHQDPSPRVQAAIAARRDTPRVILEALLLSPFREVFQAALHNENTPRGFAELVTRVRERQPLRPDELTTFYALGSPAKLLLAAHPQIPPALLQEMIDSREGALLLAVAQSPNATASLLRVLLDEESEPIRVVAAKRLSASQLPEGLPFPEVIEKTLPEWLQQRLQKSLQRQQDQRAARDPSTPPEALEVLAKTNEKELLRLLASRQDLPVQALHWFRGRFTRKLLENPAFLARLLQRPAEFYQLPGGVLQGALSQPGIPEEFLRWAVGHSLMEVRHAVAQNPASTPEILRALAQTRDLSFSLRRLIAQHPRAPRELLSDFLQSADPWLKIWAERAMQQRQAR